MVSQCVPLHAVIRLTLIMTIVTAFLSAADVSDDMDTGDTAYELKLKQKRKVILRSRGETQITGRSTLTGNQLKDAPATFGDALNAFTTLPGVMRVSTIFGALVIRGAEESANRYFVDDIPIPRPQHFGGLHSVLNNDFTSEANIYASTFPVKFGGAIGAVIDFRTADEVTKFGGNIDMGLLSGNILFKRPWTGDGSGPQGYWIASARIGYLPLVIPPIYKAITGESLFALPQYYDYQFKGKIVLDDARRHTLTLLSIGSYDTVKVLRDPTEAESSLVPEINFLTAGAGRQISAHSVGLYYDYEPSAKFKNHLLIYNSLVADFASYTSSITNAPVAVTNYPNLAGLKNVSTLHWLSNRAHLKIGLEYSLYYFSTAGSNTRTTASNFTAGTPRVTEVVVFKDTIINHVPSGYIENRFQFGGFSITPAVRADYLARIDNLAVGPRGSAGYDFSTGTSVEISGGVYQSFPQVNMALVEQYATSTSQLARSARLIPEEAVHRSLAISQKFRLWDFKVDGYFNKLYRLARPGVSSSTDIEFYNSYPIQNIGVEISVRKTPGSGTSDYYGWASYTLGKSSYDNYPTQYSQTHNLKLVAGYLAGIHSISTRIDVFSGFPYTPILGSYEFPTGSNTYQTITGATYSARYPFAHRLSFRYSQERKYAWGSWRWYIEVVNATNYAPIAEQVYDYSKPYQAGVNPQLRALEPKIPILPNFGVEIRF
jgi:hypothetical protein